MYILRASVLNTCTPVLYQFYCISTVSLHTIRINNTDYIHAAQRDNGFIFRC